MILTIAVLPIAVYLGVVSTYLLIMLAGALGFRKRQAAGGPLRIAVLVPAHNEEHQIAAILRDVAAADYPAERVTVFVIADNCSDATAAIAREHGATALERHNLEQRGKGQALDWCLREHADTLRDFDAIALVDADMQLCPAFLQEMSASLSAPGVEVVQGLNTVSNPEASWRAALGFASFTLINHVRPAGRNFLGGTAELKGSGMAFRSALLLRTGWPAHSLAEDAEFGKQLLLDGIIVHYNPDAKVTSGIPLHDSQARVQQQRWEGGKLLLFRRFFPKLVARLAARPNLRHLDAVLDILVPPLSILVMLCLLTIVLGGVADLRLAAVGALSLGVVAAAVLGGLALQRAPWHVWTSLAMAPVFLAWKLPLLLALPFRKVAGWQRTPRDTEIGK